MSRKYSVQNRTENYLKSLNKRVQNKKSRYRRDKGIELNPHIQTIKPSDFTSAKQVQAYKREMERFLKRETQFEANEKGTIFNRETVNAYKKEVERVNKRIRKERERISGLETQAYGKKLGMTVGERMKLSAKSMFPNLVELTGSLDRFTSEKELKKHIQERLKKGFYKGEFITAENTEYKRRFLMSLETVFGGKSQDLQKRIGKLNLNQFMNVYYETTKSIDINYVYDEDEELNKKLRTLYQTFGMKIPKKVEEML